MLSSTFFTFTKNCIKDVFSVISAILCPAPTVPYVAYDPPLTGDPLYSYSTQLATECAVGSNTIEPGDGQIVCQFDGWIGQVPLCERE